MKLIHNMPLSTNFQTSIDQVLNSNQQVIQQIESRAGQVSDQTVNFDEQSKMDNLPNALDPFTLDNVDLNSREQVLVGDKIMYPYQNEKGEIVDTILGIPVSAKMQYLGCTISCDRA